MISIQNIHDNECFKWRLVRYVRPAGRDPARITKVDRYFTKRLDCKDIKFPVKIRDIHKFKKSINSTTLVVLVKEIRKNVQSMYQKNAVKVSILIYYILEENIFAVIVYKLLEQ